MKGGGRKKGREEGEKGRKEGKEEKFHKFHSLNLYACIILKVNSRFFFFFFCHVACRPQFLDQELYMGHGSKSMEM